VAIKFNHKREILAIRDGFPKYYEAYTYTKIQWEDDFTENDLGVRILQVKERMRSWYYQQKS